MANRRMFSLDVVDTDIFLEMPVSAQCLYFHLGMRADDDGFVSSPKRILAMINCAIDDLRILISKGYLIPFESGVVVITHWNINNWIRPDRKQGTRFKELSGQLNVINDAYMLMCQPNDNQMTTRCQPNDNQMTTECHTEDRIGKNRIDKNRLDNIICPEPEPDAPAQPEKAAEKSGLLIPLNDNTVYDVPLDKIKMWEHTYPAVDVRQEILKMIAWCHSNPAKKKTKRGVDRFINSWLDREQNKGGSSTRKGEMTGGQKGNSYDRWNDIRGCLTVTEDNTDGNQDLPFQ